VILILVPLPLLLPLPVPVPVQSSQNSAPLEWATRSDTVLAMMEEYGEYRRTKKIRSIIVTIMIHGVSVIL